MAKTGTTKTQSRRVSRATYRRRRLVVFGSLILVLGLIVWGVWHATQPANVVATPTGTAAPIITEHPVTGETIPPALQVTPKPESQVPPRCSGEDVYVEALSLYPDYEPEGWPRLGIRLTNQIGTACSINIGTATQKYTVTQGDVVWWRSTDCQVAGVDHIVSLEAGQVLTTDPFVAWDRYRSAPETCESNEREFAPAGTYAAQVEIGGFSSQEPATFTVADAPAG